MIESRKNNIQMEEEDVNNLIGLSIEQAYDIQRIIISNIGLNVCGWKLGGTNIKTRDIFKVEELYWGPVYEGAISNDPSQIDLNCGEVEIAFKIKNDISKSPSIIDSSYLYDYIDSVALAIEYPWSVFKSFGKASIIALIADCCASGQCLISEEIPFEEFDNKVNVSVEVDGFIVESGATDLLVDDLFVILCDFITNAKSKGFILEAGQWIFTGGLTSCRTYTQGSVVNITSNHLPGLSFLMT